MLVSVNPKADLGSLPRSTVLLLPQLADEAELALASLACSNVMPSCFCDESFGSGLPKWTISRIYNIASLSANTNEASASANMLHSVILDISLSDVEHEATLQHL